MWELIKNNPVVKIVVVLIVGFVGFGILANLISGFGYGNYGIGREGGGYGGFASTTGVLVYLYSVVCRLLVVALVISVIVLIIRLAYKYFNGEGATAFKSPLNDPYIKTTAALGISVLTLVIATPILSGIFGIGMNHMGGYGMRMANGYGDMNSYYGNNGFDVDQLFVLILKLFLILSVIGVLAGLVMFFLKNYSGLLLASTSTTNKCTGCGSTLNKAAQYCSNCGQKQMANELQPSAPATTADADPETTTNVSMPGKGAEKSKNSVSDTKKSATQSPEETKPVT